PALAALVFAGGVGVDAPVDEAAELGVAEPGEALIAFRKRVLPPPVEGIVHRRFVALAGFGFDAAVFLCDRQRRNRKRDGDHGSPHKLHHESILSETWYSPRLSTKEET